MNSPVLTLFERAALLMQNTLPFLMETINELENLAKASYASDLPIAEELLIAKASLDNFYNSSVEQLTRYINAQNDLDAVTAAANDFQDVVEREALESAIMQSGLRFNFGAIWHQVTTSSPEYQEADTAPSSPVSATNLHPDADTAPSSPNVFPILETASRDDPVADSQSFFNLENQVLHEALQSAFHSEGLGLAPRDGYPGPN